MEHVSAEAFAEREERLQRSNKISNLMGQYLLQGWRMLNSYCTVCDAPLFLNKDGDIYCVACNEVDNPNKQESESMFTEESVPNGASGDALHSLKKQQSPDSSNYLGHVSSSKATEDSAEKVNSESDRKRKRSDTDPELIGQYLLKGWRMHDARCPVCNTVLLLSKEENLCCITCNKIDWEKDLEAESMPMEALAQNNVDRDTDTLSFSSLKNSPTAEDLAESERRRQRSDRISELMAQYLLKGWRMLENCCSVCNTILFLNKQGNLYCVACSEVDNREKSELKPMPHNPGDGGNSPSCSTKQSPLVADKSPIELHHVEYMLRNVIVESCHRLFNASNPVEIEKFANSIKSLSDALLNVRKCLSM